jgi:hypothetical protein
MEAMTDLVSFDILLDWKNIKYSPIKVICLDYTITEMYD